MMVSFRNFQQYMSTASRSPLKMSLEQLYDGFLS
jgi:hypothetical protein